MIVSPDPHPPPGTSSSNNNNNMGTGPCPSNFQCLRSPVPAFVGPTSSCVSCVQCQQQQQQLYDQQHHYQEIGQNPRINPATQQRPTNCDIPMNQTNQVMHCNTNSCCCGAATPAQPQGASGQFYQSQAQHRQQLSIPESETGSQFGPRNYNQARSCRGPVLSSSTENLQSESSQNTRRKKR